MTETLKIPKYLGTAAGGKKLELADDAVTQGFAILAMRDSGKSNTAGVMQEIFAKRGDQFIVIDPPGAHVGIRTAADAAGKPSGASGLDVLIVGGDNGDIPLDPRGGTELAQVLMETKASCVINIKHTRTADRRSFLTAFGEELYAHNVTPLHLFIEEADEIIPQQLDNRDEMAVRSVWRRIIKGGRSSGLGFTIITQRPAMVDKTSIYQIDNLIVMSLMGPADLKTVTDWFKHHKYSGDKSEIIDSIPSLEKGQCWLLSPRWLKQMIRLDVRRRVTYHAGRTPKKGEHPVSLKKFDVSEIAGKFRAALEQRKSEWAADQATAKDLKLQIRDLTQKLRAAEKAQPAPAKADPKQLERMVEAAVKEDRKATAAEVEKIRRELQATVEEYAKVVKMQFGKILKTVSDELQEAGRIVANIPRLAIDKGGIIARPAPPLPRMNETVRVRLEPAVKVARPDEATAAAPVSATNAAGAVPESGDVGKTPREMLIVLAQWDRAMTLSQLAAQVGIKRRGSSMRTYLSTLRSRAFIQTAGEQVTITAAGREYLGDVELASPQTTAEVVSKWKPKIGKTPAQMLDELVKHGGDPVDRESLAAAAGISPGGSSMRTYLSTLRSAGLIVNVGDGIAANKETLFL